MNIFSNATEIVALHGAALSNLVFSNLNCRIFEIFNHPYRMYVFRDLAKMTGNSYTSTEMNSIFAKLENWMNEPVVKKVN